MYTNYDIKKAMKNAIEKGETDFTYNEEINKLYLKSTGKPVCTFEEYAEWVREKAGCAFETVFYEHCNLQHIVRCKKCGTVVFTGNDERWEPQLKCPVCTTYKPHNSYWTGEEIAKDPEKQKAITQYENWQKEMDEEASRREKRGGLYNWQRWQKKIHTKNHHVIITHQCFGWGQKTWKKLRTLEIDDFARDEYGGFTMGNGHGHHWSIPLNVYSFYIKFIYPHTKKRKDELNILKGDDKLE
jgi:hypothetical protein